MTVLVSHQVPLRISQQNCAHGPSTHRPTRISIPQTFWIKILHSPILSKLPNPVKHSAFWCSMTTLKLSPKTCLHYFVWIVSEIDLHAKCLLFGWPRRGGKNTCCNISCTKSTTTTWKRKEEWLTLKISFKVCGFCFFCHPVPLHSSTILNEFRGDWGLRAFSG